MSYVFHICFALIGSLGLLQLGWALPGEHPWLVPALAPAPYVLGWLSRRAFLAGRFRLGSLLERLLAIAPVLLQGAAVGALGWTATLERSGFPVESEGWIDLGLLAALAPYVVLQLLAIDARARFLVFAPDSSGRARAFHARMFLSALLPFAAYLCGAHLLARSEVWKVRLETIGLLGGLATVLLIGLFFYGMPFFLRFAWDTTPIERGWARTMLEQVARSAGFRYRELLVWRTGQQMSNAAVVGFTERSRFVFFSDLLLQQLGPRELAAVFAHEMGHARRAHAVVFGAFALGFLLAAQVVLGAVEIESPLWGGLVLLAAVALFYLAFGYLSRRFELEADLESLRVVGESGALVRALELVTGAHAHERSSWRHFSTRERVAFLQRAEQDPLVGIRLRRKLGHARVLGFALFAVAALVQVLDLARSWDEDWLTADLRLGFFEEAARRAGRPGVDGRIAELARFAARVPPDARDPVSLERAALLAEEQGDVKGARDWLELATLRGGKDLETRKAALEAAGEAGDDPEVPAALRSGGRP